ncbi:MAG: tetratricopeptide repeat protein [Bacteroidota bacterium]
MYSQRSKTGDNLTYSEKERMAEVALQEGKYDKAVLLYKKLLDQEPDNSIINFLVGYCYLNTDYGKEQAIGFFEKAVSNIQEGNSNNAPLEAYYYLAEAYYDNYNFIKAIDILNQLSEKIPGNEDLFNFRVKLLKEKCENGKCFSSGKLEIKVENLLEVNSKYSDHSPLINNDETELIFTSRREETKVSVKNYDDQFDANIYMSEKIDSAWQLPYSLGNSVNSSFHEAATFISADYKTMIIHKYDRYKGSLYISKMKESGEWGIAVALGPNINTKYRETAGCLTPDGSKLYFVSDRKGGYGGLDIYVSDKLINGTWGPARNLGATINTAFNEETPFIHMNGTLFFCSEGHNSMGGYDIFASSIKKKNNWSSPVNLGIPINSVKDDFFYIPSPNGRFAYYASKRQGGKGQSDIYRVELSEQGKKNYAVVSGNIFISEENVNQKDIKIHISDLNGKKVNLYKPTLKKNKFNLFLRTGKSYILTVEFQNLTTHKIKLTIENKGSFLSLEQHIILDDIIIKSLEDTEYHRMLTQGNIQTKEYISKPKSKDISDDYILVGNTDTNVTIDTDIDNQNEDESKVFSIQLLDSKTSLNNAYFADIEDVKSFKKENGSYIYYLGEYIYEWEATIKLRMLKDKYPKAFIFVNTFISKKIN